MSAALPNWPSHMRLLERRWHHVMAERGVQTAALASPRGKAVVRGLMLQVVDDLLGPGCGHDPCSASGCKRRLRIVHRIEKLP
jgi:hypothetical protein